MARLSSLPPELLRIIVEHLDSTTDLHHAILGSKNVAQVFWTSTAFHLSKVLQNSISSLAQPFALAILDVDALPRTALKSEEDATESFLVQFFNNPRISFPTDMESLIVMSQRQNRIARFLTHYSALALFKCGAVLESIKPLPWWNPSSSDCANDQTQEILATNNLSPMERARFERGFYIHELLCHLFPCLSSYEQSEKHHSLFSGKQQHDLFISGIPPFQLEEVRCVHQYYMEIAGKMFDA